MALSAVWFISQYLFFLTCGQTSDQGARSSMVDALGRKKALRSLLFAIGPAHVGYRAVRSPYLERAPNMQRSASSSLHLQITDETPPLSEEELKAAIDETSDRFIAELAKEAIAPGLVRKLTSEEEYREKVDDARNQNKVVVLEFTAKWCKSCKAFRPKFERLARDWPDVEFYEVPFERTKMLCKELGITKLPYLQAIHQGKIKDDFCTGPKKFFELSDWLQSIDSETQSSRELVGA